MTHDPTISIITRDMLPAHPRFKWENPGVRILGWFEYKPGAWQSINESLLLNSNRYILEDCVANAYMWWGQKKSGLSLVLQVEASVVQSRWLDLLAPKPVFGKDWNCWTRKRADGMIDEFCFTEEHPADDNCPIYQKRQGPWKRALFNSKVIE